MRYTEAPQRREELVRRLTGVGYMSSQRLASDLGVSEMTIRRDLDRLGEDGLLHRVAGGAVLAGAGQAPAGGEPFDQRTTHGLSEKRAIARAALDLVGGAASLALDAGTTVAQVADDLPCGVLVATHSVPVITACAERTDIQLIGLGGAYQHATRSFAGPGTRAAIADLAVDVALLSAVAVGPGGLYCANPLDAETKQLLAGCAGRVILLADHTKLTASAPLRFATLSGIDVLVTDAGIDPEHLAMLRNAVAQVVVA